MFGKLSQIGKNLSEEWDNAVNAGKTGTGSNVGRKSTEGRTLAQKKELLSVTTPEPSTLEVIGDDSEKKELVKDEQPTEQQQEMKEDIKPSNIINGNASEQAVAKDSQGAVVMAELPADIQKKLRKFDRYEAKYPCKWTL